MKTTLKCLLAAADVAALVMLIVCTVYGWTIAGVILLALVAVQYVAQTVAFILARGAWGWASPIALVVLGAVGAFPVVIVGFGMTVVDALFVVGAIAALLSAAYTFASVN